MLFVALVSNPCLLQDAASPYPLVLMCLRENA
jgi:Na+/serine symporter